MASYSKPYVTPEEYLAIERKAATKSEYWQGQMYAMAGASRYHARIVRNISAALTSGLRNRACQNYVSDMRILTPTTGLYTYPDVVVSCGEEKYLDEAFDTLLNPVLIFEVLSPSTEDFDTGKKFASYRSIVSLQEYVTVAQDRFQVQHWYILNGHWTLNEVTDPSAEILLRSLPEGVRLQIAEIYDKVDWPRGET